jgi:hypothetical protein
MEKFARKHNCSADKLRKVSRGELYSHKGWKTLRREKKSGYKTPRGHKMSPDSSAKKSLSLKLAYLEGRKVAGEKLKKVYNGITSPEGIVYTNVVGLAEFCRKHNLRSVGAMSELCLGKRKHYKGWTYNPSVTLENK